MSPLWNAVNYRKRCWQILRWLDFYLHCGWYIWSVVAFCACGKLSSLNVLLWKTGQPDKTLAPGAASTTGKVGAYEEISQSLGQKMVVFPTCARSFKISTIPNLKKGSLSDLKTNVWWEFWKEIELHWIGCMEIFYIISLWSSGRGSETSNHTKFVTELTEARVADITENPHLDP